MKVVMVEYLRVLLYIQVYIVKYSHSTIVFRVRVAQVHLELQTLRVHHISSPVLSRFRVARSLVLV